MRNSARGKRRLPVLAGALTMTLAMAFGGQCAFAQSANEEDLPLDTKLFRGFMKDLGLQRDGENQIEYRERPPLVVPPGRSLPAPQSGAAAAAANNPAWPKDPDVLRQRQEATVKRKQPRTAAEADIEGSRALRPSELEVGRGPVAPTATPVSPEESGRALRPSELGSKGLFGGLFSAIGPERAEAVPFDREPPRENLTAPPAGYQTPSPNHPYGFEPKRGNNAKPKTMEERAVGN